MTPDMNDSLYGPQDFDQQEQEIALRRRRFAQMAEAQSPQGQMVGSYYVAPNPLQYIAAGLRGVGGMAGESQAANELKSLQSRRQQAIADALRGFTEATQGKPEVVAGGEVSQPAQPPDMNAAYANLLRAPDAGLRQAGMQGMTQLPQIQAQAVERQAQREFQRQQVELQNKQKIEQLEAQHQQRMEFLQQSNADRAAMAAEQRAFQQQMATLAKSSGAGAQPYFQPVQTAQGVMAFNARTGRVEPVTMAGAPVIGAQADPTLQGAITGAETLARKSAEGVADARTEARKAEMFLQQLTQAETILKQNPTASGIGAVRDAAGRLVGFNTQSADRAGQLEALSGWLVANVPRMEGPQSNFDVQNYMTMAGKIGDRTVPVSERLAALNEVRKLQQKYSESARARAGTANPAGTAAPVAAPVSAPAAAPAQRQRIRFDAQGNQIP